MRRTYRNNAGDLFSVRNILAAFDNADIISQRDGMTWYSRARTIATEIGEGDAVIGSAILAVLSPRVKWNRNVEMARDIVSHREVRGLGANIRKAEMIRDTRSWAEYVKGDKVLSFMENILAPSDSDKVTVDMHAIDIAMGTRNGQNTRPGLSKSDYAAIADLYRIAARERNIRPLELQAVTWEMWRKKFDGIRTDVRINVQW